jgi:hypothetical protein
MIAFLLLVEVLLLMGYHQDSRAAGLRDSSTSKDYDDVSDVMKYLGNVDGSIVALHLSYRPGQDASVVWDYVTSREYGPNIGDNHTNVPQALAWYFRGKAGQGAEYREWTAEVMNGVYKPDNRSGTKSSTGKGATATAPTNLTVGRLDYMLSLSARTRGGNRFKALMALMNALDSLQASPDLASLRGFRITEFMSRAQLSTLLSTPDPMLNDNAHRAFWLNMEADRFRVSNNSTWTPLHVHVVAASTFGLLPSKRHFIL